jgi:aconitate hydratase
LPKSFARIHMANLVNFGILPLTFADKEDYAGVSQGDKLCLEVKDLGDQLIVENQTNGTKIKVNLSLSNLEKSLVYAGGKLAYIKTKQTK